MNKAQPLGRAFRVFAEPFGKGTMWDGHSCPSDLNTEQPRTKIKGDGQECPSHTQHG
jgi:hypothetical protein